MPGQTVVEYGSVTMFHCHTRQFRQELVTEESGVDQIFWRFTISVVGYLTGDSDITTVKVTPLESSPSGQHHSVRENLEPRQQFTMRVNVPDSGVGGDTLLTATPYDVRTSGRTGAVAGFDVNSGPRCESFEISHFSPSVLRVEATFTVCIVDCEFITNTSGVLSNRWTVVDDLDQNRRTKRTWIGKLRIANPRLNPNSFRALVFPVQEDGYKRTGMSFKVSEDSMTLYYTINDEECYDAPPPFCTSWQFEQSINGRDGVVSTESIRARLDAERNVDLTNLAILCARLVESRLIRTIHVGRTTRVDDFRLTAHMGDRDHGVSIECSVVNAAAGSASAPFLPGNITQATRAIEESDILPGYNRNIPSKADFRGVLPFLRALASHFQDPCGSVSHDIDDGYAPEELRAGSGFFSVSDIPVSVQTVSNLPELPQWLNLEHAGAVYEYWQIDSRYESDQMKVQLPVAGFSQATEADNRTSVVCSLGYPMAKRVVRISAQRNTRWPELPIRTDSFRDKYGVVHTLMKENFQPQSENRSVEGKQIFAIDGEIIYALSRKHKPEEALLIGANPWQSGKQANYTDENIFTGAVV